MGFALRLCPVRDWRHPHLGGVWIVVVDQSADDDSFVRDIVDVRRGREAVFELDEESGCCVGGAISPEGA